MRLVMLVPFGAAVHRTGVLAAEGRRGRWFWSIPGSAEASRRLSERRRAGRVRRDSQGPGDSQPAASSIPRRQRGTSRWGGDGFGAAKRWTRSSLDGMSPRATIELPRIERRDPAAVIFTTGSTGPPKGVLYTHGTFHAQIDRIRERYDIHRGSRDLACFPLFGLFDAVMGVTTIIPDMDPTRPADVNPQRLVEAATQWEVDQAFGSPALWNRVVRWSQANASEQPFPTLRRILSAGAPVPASTLIELRKLIHPDAEHL